MRESYCGLCDDCQLGNSGLLETVSRLKGYLDQVRANVWLHCFPGPDGFSLPEFRKGLEWFLSTRSAPAARKGGACVTAPSGYAPRAGIWSTVMSARTWSPATNTHLLLVQFPDVKINLRRRQLKFKAREYHRKLEAGKK